MYSNTIYNYTLNFGGTTAGDLSKLTPRLLDIFTGSDMIREEILTDTTDEKTKAQIDFLCIQNCLQRIRDIFFCDIPLKEKRELIKKVNNINK